MSAKKKDLLLTFSISCYQSMVEQLDALAERRSKETGLLIGRSWIVRELLRDALERLEAREGKRRKR